jgi:hypothetical protein
MGIGYCLKYLITAVIGTSLYQISHYSSYWSTSLYQISDYCSYGDTLTVSKLRGLIPRANYTDRAIATCQRFFFQVAV